MYAKKIVLTATTLVLTSLAGLAQTNEIIKKEIITPTFTGIEAAGIFNVIITDNATTKIIVETSTENQSNITVEVKNDKLALSTNGKSIKNGKVNVYIDAPVINSIKLSGSAELTTNGELIEDKLTIEMSGAAEGDMQLKVTELATKLSGAAELKLTGTALNHSTTISGAAELKSIDLKTENTTAKLSGAGHGKVNVKNELNAKISGAASISFKEDPAIKNIDVTGAGSVTKKEEDTEIAKAEMNANGDSDTTRFKFKNKNIIIVDGNNAKNDSIKKQKNASRWYHWAGVELGFNGMLNSKNGTDLGANYSFMANNYGRSYHMGLNFFEKGFSLYKHKINVVTGAGLEFANYSFKNNVTLLPDTNQLATISTGIKYDKNKLRANYITVPLLLDFNTSKKEKHNWHLTAGIIGAWRYGAFTKQVYQQNGHNVKNKVKDDYTLNDFKFSATVRAGYRGLNVFANYGLNTLFNKTNNPDIYPVTVGITVIPFK